MAYVGRFFGDKLIGLANGIWGNVPVDAYGDETSWSEARAQIPGASCMDYQGMGEPREVMQRYRIVSATGIAAIEAMACGAAILAHGLSPTVLARWREVMYVPEFFYPSEDYTAFSDYERLQDDKTATRAARMCRAWVEQHHDAKRMAEQFVAVYEEAIGG